MQPLLTAWPDLVYAAIPGVVCVAACLLSGRRPRFRDRGVVYLVLGAVLFATAFVVGAVYFTTVSCAGGGPGECDLTFLFGASWTFWSLLAYVAVVIVNEWRLRTYPPQSFASW